MLTHSSHVRRGCKVSNALRPSCSSCISSSSYSSCSSSWMDMSGFPIDCSRPTRTRVTRSLTVDHHGQDARTGPTIACLSTNATTSTTVRRYIPTHGCEMPGFPLPNPPPIRTLAHGSVLGRRAPLIGELGQTAWTARNGPLGFGRRRSSAQARQDPHSGHYTEYHSTGLRYSAQRGHACSSQRPPQTAVCRARI